jgi:DNA mismatch repair ATPase MutS
MKAHLLHEDRDVPFPTEPRRRADVLDGLPEHERDLVSDLGLATLFDAMSGDDPFLYEVSARVVLAGLDDPAAIVYRQHVLADCLQHTALVRELYDIATEAVEVPRRTWGWSSRFPASILSGATSALELYVDLLRRVRRLADEHAGEVRSEGFTALFRTIQRDLDDAYFHTIADHLARLRFKDGVLLSAKLGRANVGVDYVLRSPGAHRSSWKERVGLAQKTSYSFSIPPRDEAGARAVGELRARGLNLVANATAQAADHIGSFFAMLRLETGFYVSCLNLHDRLTRNGEPLCTPVPVGREPVRLSFEGLGDACLSLRLDQPVVGNDVDADGRPLVVITGANSGGKSTFLRSVGLAQLMMQAGMFVQANSFESSVSAGVLTHFARDEDTSMQRGRLDEELSRMSKIADRLSPRSMVLFNESFAGTNEREGSEIARQVVRALLDVGCTVLIVSHLYDFADSFLRTRPDTTRFLRAVRDEDGRRTFALVEAEPLPTSYGEDLYDRIFGGDRPGPDGHEPGAAPRTGASGDGTD